MECILWNKKKTPDYKYTFLGEEPILFVGELFNNSNCLITISIYSSLDNI